jgi:hypothetical protein
MKGSNNSESRRTFIIAMVNNAGLAEMYPASSRLPLKTETGVTHRRYHDRDEEFRDICC